MVPFLVLINWLEQLTEPETLYLLDHLFIIKDVRWEQPDATGRVHWGFHALDSPVVPKLQMATKPEALCTPSFWVFTKASSHRHGWLKDWPSM